MVFSKNWLSQFLFVFFLLIGNFSIANSANPIPQKPTSTYNISSSPTPPDSSVNSQKSAGIPLNTLFGYGIYFGFVLILIIYSTLVYTNLNQPIFGWFSVYILALSIHVFLISGVLITTESTLFFQIGVPNAFLIQISFIHFFQFLIHRKKQEFKNEKWLNYLLYSSLVLSVLYFIIPFSAAITFLLRAILITSISIIFGGLRNNTSLSKKQVVLIFGALTFVILAGALLALNQWSEAFSKESLFRWGVALIAFHILLVSISILYRVKKLNDDRESLWLDIRLSKKELIAHYLKGVEEENIRIVSELNNSVLVDIENLKKEFASTSLLNTDTEAELNEVQESIHKITSKLMGNQTTSSNLIQQINEFVQSHQSDQTQITFQFFNFSVILSTKVEEQLFRIIQESVQNAEKYANATIVEIQIIQNETELILSIEDNGNGFSLTEKTDGIGLLNMRKRSLKIGGTLNINTTIGKGTSVFVALGLDE